MYALPEVSDIIDSLFLGNLDCLKSEVGIPLLPGLESALVSGVWTQHLASSILSCHIVLPVYLLCARCRMSTDVRTDDDKEKTIYCGLPIRLCPCLLHRFHTPDLDMKHPLDLNLKLWICRFCNLLFMTCRGLSITWSFSSLYDMSGIKNMNYFARVAVTPMSSRGALNSFLPLFTGIYSHHDTLLTTVST